MSLESKNMNYRSHLDASTTVAMVAELPAKFVLVCALLVSYVTVCYSHEEAPKLLLISFDGFRWDYLTTARLLGKHTPTFDKLINEGVSVRNPGITNAFITKTFPNHYTIVTGLYEEDHGVVANDFYDPDLHETFNINAEDAKDIKWWSGTGMTKVVPIWVTNEQEGGEHRASGVFMWPGSDVNGQRPTYAKTYNGSVAFNERADEVVGWFVDKTKPINFGVLYMPEPDHTGHRHGPDSVEVADKIEELDANMDYLIQKLEEAHLFHGLNIIVTSDHGMESVNKLIYISDVLSSDLYTSNAGSPVKHIWPKPGHDVEVYSKLSTLNNTIVYWKKDIPERFHYQHNRRIPPIVLVADPGFEFCDDRVKSCDMLKGDHGYDNSLPSMHPIFIAHGPAFKKNYVSPPFETVSIYSLMCHLLELTPRANNGSFDSIKHIISNGDNLNLTLVSFICSVGFAAFISGVWCIGACRSQRYILRSRVDGSRKLLQLGTMTSTSSDGCEPLLVSDEEEDFA